MSVTTTNPIEVFAVCAELIDWSQRAGLPGDYVKLWRKHEAVFHCILAPPLRRDEGSTHKLRQLELENWLETLHRTLRTDILERIAASFASVGGSALWEGLGPERQRQIARAREARACSAEASFIAALLRFRQSPACRNLTEALRAMEDLFEARSPRTGGLGAEQLRQSLDRLVDVIVEEIPSVACEVLASEVEKRFSCAADRSWLDDVSMSRSKSRLDDRWSPTWEQFGFSHARVEPPGQWFVPEIQARYEELRLAREVEQAQAEAEAEDRRRANEIAEKGRRQDEERLAAQTRENAELAARRNDEHRRHFMEKVNEEARQLVRDEMETRGLTLKSIPEPQRSAWIREVEEALIRRWVGNRRTKRTESDTKSTRRRGGKVGAASFPRSNRLRPTFPKRGNPFRIARPHPS